MHPALEPLTADNERLRSHVAPTDWQNPKPQSKYNLVVIGAGTAGLVSAMGAAGLGAKVALVERSLMGGDCLNVGCVPSKALLAAARRMGAINDAAQFGISLAQPPEIDFAAVMDRMRALRADIAPMDSAKRFREAGIDVFFGEASFCDPHAVRVGESRLSFSKAVIATGARPVVPEIPGLTDASVYTNETLFSLTQLPPRLAVIGGGPIGCEMAQAFARFGADVTIIEQGRRLLPKEDPEASQLLARRFACEGIHLRFQTELKQVVANDGESALRLEDRDGNASITVDAILVAAGRAPNVQRLGLTEAGVEFDEHDGIIVDDYLQTTNKDIYAAGDVASKWKFTHAADFLARTAIQNALSPTSTKASQLIVPWATYTDPEVAHVGLTAEQAAAEGTEIDTYTIEMSDVDRAILNGEAEGFVRIHTQKGKDKIVGATIVHAEAGNLIGSLSLAMSSRIGLGKIAKAIHPYPTVAEAIRKAGDAYNRTRLTPVVKTFMDKYLSWQRR